MVFLPPEQQGPHSYTNYRKANWTLFRRETEQAFSQVQPPTSVEGGEKVLRRILQKASKKHIPRGKTPNYTPGLSEISRELIQQRDTLRSNDPHDPQITVLDEQIQREINRKSQEEWRETVESCAINWRPWRLWKTIQRLSGKRAYTAPNQPIFFAGKCYTNKREIATRFVKQFTRPFPHKHNPRTRILLRTVRKKHRLNHDPMPFTPSMVAKVLRESGNSTAPSPDGLTILQLKNLGPIGLRYLCKLFNLSYAHASLPAIWKRAIILPLLKPNKPKDQGPSYRPISLLCPASKVLERLMLPLILPHLQTKDSQHGYRAKRSTTTALLPLAHRIASGINQIRPPHRTVATAVDFSMAFDTVNHTALLSDICESTMEPNTVRWLFTYLRGRMASCLYNGQESRSIIIHQGVPQGSVLSPALFNYYVSSYPHNADLTTSYADDFTSSATASTIESSANIMADHVREVEMWAANKELQISSTKSTVTLFTSDNSQSNIHPRVPLGEDFLPLEKYPKILGVTFDPHFHFHKHVEEIVKRAKSRLNILKALTGTTWGQHKETIVATYKALIDSIFSYAAPVWFPVAGCSNASVTKLQTVQNAALRIATGCHKMSSIDHLHMEAEIMTVKEHLNMLCTQFLATCLQENHPSFPIVTADSGPRTVKKTLQSRYIGDLSRYTGGTTQIADPDIARQTVHREAVRESIEARGTNRILGTRAPAIDPTEKELPRKTRRTLAQMRSGFCIALNDYRHRIGQSDTPICPCCRQDEHTVQHVFGCSEHPTNLQPMDLWLRPVDVAEFLESLPYMDLPESRRPPPEPPP